jgi:hypothetical protein
LSHKADLEAVKQRLNELSDRLSKLELQVNAIRRLMALEEAGAGVEPVTPAADQPSRPEAAAMAQPELAPEARQAIPPEETRAALVQEKPAPLGPAQAQETFERPHRDLESLKRAKWLEDWEQALPGNWLSRIGILALFIGLIFLVKLAYDRHWIGPVVQLIMGLVIGALLLWGGQHWKKRYRAWAQALTGGGLAVLYLSIFASYALHGLMGFFPTFVLMFLVTVLATAIALRQDSMAIAIIGIAGAFLVPIILGSTVYSGSRAETGGGNPGLLIAYILLLDAGVVWLSKLRNWRWLTLLGLVGSIMVFELWYADSGLGASLALTMGTLTAIFLAFVAATTLFHIVWRLVPEPTDLALMSLNAAAYFGASYLIMRKDYQDWLGAFSLLLAGFHGLIGYLALRRSENNRRLFHFAIGIAVVFLTIAIPLQLDRAWITSAWAAEGAVLIWIASRQSMPKLQLWAVGVFSLVLIRLLYIENVIDRASFRPVLNDDMFLPFAASIVAFAVAAYFLRRDPKVLRPWFFPCSVLLANLLTIRLFSAEIVGFVGRRIVEAEAVQAGRLHIQSLENAQALGLIMLWAVYACCLVTAGVRKNWPWLRNGAYALIVIAVGRTLPLLDSKTTGIQRETATPILNYSFGSFVLCTCALYLIAYVMAKSRGSLGDLERKRFPVPIVAANVLSLAAMSSEVITFVPSGYAKSMGLTLLWAAYAFVLIVVGILRKWRRVRLGGLALLAVAIVKLFVIDTFTLGSGYRVAAYLILGILLLAGGYVYHRYGEVIKGFILDQPPKRSVSRSD